MVKKTVQAIRMEEYSDEDDDDAPMEVTSKKNKSVGGPDIMLAPDVPVEMSLFEQVQQKKKQEKERKEKRQDKEKKLRVKVKKTDQGQFKVATKFAAFNVVSLDKGIEKSLQPKANFREELLTARTAQRRGNVKLLAERRKWCAK